MPKYSDVRAVLEKAINRLDGAERQLAAEAMQDLYRIMDLGPKIIAAQGADLSNALFVEMAAIVGKYHD